MALQLYLLASLMVFLLAIGPFLSDPARPKRHLSSWAFLALAVVLSPITLPNMLKRWMGHRGPSTSIRVPSLKV